MSTFTVFLRPVLAKPHPYLFILVISKIGHKYNKFKPHPYLFILVISKIGYKYNK